MKMSTPTLGRAVAFIAGGAIAVLLSGCGDPIPPGRWKQEEVSLNTVSGFEDCTLAKLRFHENSHPVLLVRCPHSQVSIDKIIPQGNYPINQASAVIEAGRVEQDQRTAKIAALESTMKRIQAEIDNIKK